MWRVAKGLLLAGVLLLSAAHPAASQDEEEWLRYNSAGNFATSRGRSKEAEPMYREALRVAERFGEDDERLWASLRALAVTLKFRGKYEKLDDKLDEAERLFLRLLGMAEKMFDPERGRLDSVSRELLMSLDDLGDIEETRGRFAESEAYYRRAFALQRSRYRINRSGENERAYYASLDFLAEFYCRRGMYDEAKAIDKRVVPDCVLDAEKKSDRK